MCYRHQKMIFGASGEGLFDDCVDSAFLLTMENSKRDWKKEYSKHIPCSRLIVQYNKGFRECSKPQLFEQSTDSDLTDALTNVFLMALSLNYQRILVLEDDFTFDEYTTKDTTRISDWICKHFLDVYNLGPLPHFIALPVGYHFRTLYFFTSHAVIYCNPNYMKRFVMDVLKGTKKIVADRWWNNYPCVKYHYYKPIAFQIFEVTANSMCWCSNGLRVLIKLLQLDINYYNYSNVYHLINFLNICVLPIFIIVPLVLIIRVVRSNVKISTNPKKNKNQ